MLLKSLGDTVKYRKVIAKVMVADLDLVFGMVVFRVELVFQDQITITESGCRM
ncbi:hypothetical protein D3C78_1569570 [compost metagenome]